MKALLRGARVMHNVEGPTVDLPNATCRGRELIPLIPFITIAALFVVPYPVPVATTS